MSDVNFTPTQARELLMTLVGATGDETVKEVLKAAILAKAATDGLKADQLSAEQVVRDLFIQNELHRVPPAFEIKVGRPAAASGEGAVGMVDHYSRFAPQPQALTKEYDKLDEELGQMRAYMKSLGEQIEAVGKAVATLVAVKAEDDEKEMEEKADPEGEMQEKEDEDEEGKSLSKYVKSLAAEIKADLVAKAEDEEEDEKEDGEDEETGKSFSALTKVNLAKATYVAAKGALKETVAKSKRTALRKAVEKALRKAYALAKAAEEDGEKDKKDMEAHKEAKKSVSQIEEYAYVHGIALVKKAAPKASVKAESKPEDEENQKTWPNEDSMKAFNDTIAKMEAMQTDVRGFMDRIAMTSKGKTAIETVEPLAKAMESPNFFADKARYIDDQAKARRIDDATYGAAMEVLNAMEMAKSGRISQDVPNALLNGASGKVKEIFKTNGGNV